MHYRPYGTTGHDISVVAMGGMRFGRPEAIDEMAEIPLYLYDHGVNYFDTAPGYCAAKSETILGTAVKEMKRRGGPPFFVSTKTFAGSEAEVRKELDTSLERLNVERIDFYHIWCIRTWQEWEERKAKGVLEAFRKVKDEGLVRHVVISTHLNSDDICRLIDEGPFEGILMGYCAANFAYREQGAAAAHDKGLGVMIMNPLAGGTYWQSPESFAFLKQRPGDDLLRGGLRFVVSNPNVTGALVGVRSMDDARATVQAVESMDLYGPQELADLKRSIEKEFTSLCTSCQYCKDCPAEMPVPKLMDTANVLEFNATAAREVWGRLKYHWGINDLPAVVDACLDCGRCEEACTQQLPIRQRLKRLKEAWHEAEAQIAAEKKS
ncbi:MAG: aldo/keto reductase [Planctomycetes bacterium]|nr:aldo/keto reductase [Planctomycetota bacterium]